MHVKMLSANGMFYELPSRYTDSVISNRPELSMNIKFCHYTVDLYPQSAWNSDLLIFEGYKIVFLSKKTSKQR